MMNVISKLRRLTVMENGGPQEEPIKENSRKKMKNKNKQATVLKQLNNQNLYPIQERIGIYVTAALSALGLILITYTAVMSVVSNNVANGEENDPYAPADVDVDEVSDMLIDLDDLLDDDEPDQSEDDSDQFVESGDSEDDEPRSSGSNNANIGIINDNMVNLWREPGSPDAMLALQEGYEVILINFDYNAYWAHVEVETDAIDGISTLRGFIQKEFIDIE